jgi:predicted transcriptional regulator of viral defense system
VNYNDYLSNLLDQFGNERRRVVSTWRIGIYCTRIAHAANEPLPDFGSRENDSQERIIINTGRREIVARRIENVLRALDRRGMIAPVDGENLSGIYLIDVPYANLVEVTEEQIIQEANPWAVFSHLTALAYHGLTDRIPDGIEATCFSGHSEPWLPLGTTPEDWVGQQHPPARRPKEVRGVAVSWSLTKGTRRFGVQVGYSAGSPIYVTDVERTLLDALRSPAKAGGIANVLEAWRRAEIVDVDRLVSYTDQMDFQVLRQRVGYLLQTLGHRNPRADRWRERLTRGGSVKLDASGPYSATFSPDWNLSLNVPESILAILGKE